MRACILTLGFTGVLVFLVGPLAAQPPGELPKTPLEKFRAARDLIREGRYDVASEGLKILLESNPTEKDFLDITKTDPLAFLKLRNVATWSDDPKTNKEALERVEELIKRSEQANSAFYTNPARIGKFTNNLGESAEERIYAEDQIKRAKTAAVPILLDMLQKTSNTDLRAGILGCIPKLDIETVPGFLAAVDNLPNDLKLGVLRAILTRPDLLTILNSADTDPTPFLWYYGAQNPNDGGELRIFCRTTLERLTGSDLTKKKPEVELLQMADALGNHNARFRPGPQKLWVYDTAKMTVLGTDCTKAQAEDYLAFRNLRWAIALAPNDPTAHELFLTLSIERAVEKSKFNDLADTDATLFPILASAPSEMLIGLLNSALSQQKTALALGLTQALTARADKLAATEPAPNKPSVFGKALDYPDPRVRLAAAVGLLRAPIPQPPTHGKMARIVEILRESAAIEPATGKEMGRALIADPLDARGERVAAYLRVLGFATERFSSGRELLRRTSRAADYDLIVVDRHTANPLLNDVLAQLRPNAATTRQPVLVVASSDRPRAVPFENQLLRLACLIAVTETANIEVPPPYSYDPRKAVEETKKEKNEVSRGRDRALLELYALRMARLKRLVDGSELPYSKKLHDRLELRLPQFTYAALVAEPDYAVSEKTAPDFFKRYDSQNKVILSQPDMVRPLGESVPTAAIGRLIEQLEGAIDPARKQKLEQLMARIVPEVLGLPSDEYRDVILEEQLTKVAKGYPGVTVVPEPYSLIGFTEDVKSASADPAQLPRDPAEKKRAAKTAVEWLRRLALGEVPGYDVTPAMEALLTALRDDDLAEAAADAVGRIKSDKCQQALLSVALSGVRPVPVRTKAAERCIQHVQANGKLIPPNVITELGRVTDMEMDAGMKARLSVLNQLLARKPGEIGGLISKFPLPVPPAKEAAPPVEPPPPKKE